GSVAMHAGGRRRAPRGPSRAVTTMSVDVENKRLGSASALAFRALRADVDADTPDAAPSRRRMIVAGPLVAVVSMVAALFATGAAGISLRDPDHVAGRRFAMLIGLVAFLVFLDVFVRASRRGAGRLPSREMVREVRRERWTRHRAIAVGTALISFYVSYF